jgi:acyl-CoA synthetase (AMP-forming)/AMP-acid ligase II
MIADREWMRERIAGFGNRPALIAGGHDFTFSEIAHSIAPWLVRLDAAGICCRVVVVTGDFSQATIGAMLACALRGCIAVPQHMVAGTRLDDVIALTGAEHVIDTASGDVTCVRAAASHHPLIARLVEANEAGLILLSSGSTGSPKASLLSIDRLFERHRTRRTSPAFVTAGFMQFDHIGGFNTLTHCLFTGGTLVQLSSRDAMDVCRSIERHRIELLPATPTFLNMLLISGAHEHADLSSLKLVTYGTEVMPQSTLQALSLVMPHVTFKQTYGLSEIGIVATKSKASDSLWMKLGGDVGVKVLDGVLWLKSDSAMLGYLNAPSPIDADGWLCTGDVVEVDGDYLRINGRKEEIINVGGLKVFPAEVEDQLLRAPHVNDAVVWGKRNAVTGFIVAASIAKAADVDAARAKHEILDYCRQQMDDFKVPRFIEFVDTRLHSDRFKKIRLARRG